MVDILWDHLVLLQQDVDRDAAALKIVPSNLCKTLTDPVSMPRLPPSPPGTQQPQYHQSPQKTYLTLSPQRHTPYSAPTSPLLYTSLDYRQATPPLLVKTEFKQEFKAEYRVPHLFGSEQPLPPVQLVPGLQEATLLALPLIVGPGIAAPCLCVSSVLSSHRIFGWPAPASLLPVDPAAKVYAGCLRPRVQCSGRISPGNDNITLLTPSSLAPHQSYLR